MFFPPEKSAVDEVMEWLSRLLKEACRPPSVASSTQQTNYSKEQTMWFTLALIAVEFTVSAVVSEVWDALADD